jgi:hypothetical protein
MVKVCFIDKCLKQNAGQIEVHPIGCFYENRGRCASANNFRRCCHDSFTADCDLPGMGRMGRLQAGGGTPGTDCR